MISIIDYGAGNILSVGNMLKKVGYRNYEICKSPSEVTLGDKFILPGVGHFDYGMQRLEELGWVSFLEDEVQGKMKPFLGICLGFQLMTRGSDEGVLEGLSFFNAETKAFRKMNIEGLRVPNMGWMPVKVCRTEPLFNNASPQQRFYFVHSYFVECEDRDQVMVEADYGVPFAAGVQDGHIFGVQFHPEKSHKYGMNLMKNFASL